MRQINEPVAAVPLCCHVVERPYERAEHEEEHQAAKDQVGLRRAKAPSWVMGERHAPRHHADRPGVLIEIDVRQGKLVTHTLARPGASGGDAHRQETTALEP